MKVENRIEIFNIPEYVTCKECMGTYKSITPTHLKKHDMNMKAYRNKYPNAILFCAKSRRKCSDKIKNYWKEYPERIPKRPKGKIKEYLENAEIKEKMLKHNKAVQRLSYARKIQSEHFKEIWKNPNIRKKMLKGKGERSKKQWKNEEYRKKMIDAVSKPRSKKTKNKLSMIKKKYWENIRGTDKEIELIKNLSIAHKKTYDDEEKLLRARDVVKAAGKKKIEKRKELKEKHISKMKEFRKRGFTYQEISNKTGIGTATVYNWINNKTLQLK